MNKVIILEGPDGAGKTRLANRLVAEHGFNYVHMGKPKAHENLFLTYARRLARVISRGEHTVFDRFYYGETIYGPIMRGVSRLSLIEVELMKRVVEANGCREVLCLPPREQAIEAWSSGREEYVKELDKYNHVYDAYMKTETRFDNVWDWTINPSLDKLLQVKPILPRTVIGSPTACVLVVGEQQNENKGIHIPADWAFFEDEDCSRYLHVALGEASLHEKDLAFVNALKRTGVMRNLEEIVQRLPNFKVCLALGGVARDVCQRHHLPYVQVPHPQAHKRFQQKKSNYSVLIQEALHGRM